MNSILIKGKADEGKSTTIREICKSLNPERVWELIYDKKELKETTVGEIFNNTYVIQVGGKKILIAAGAPTEQKIRITLLIKICVELEVEIDFAIVAKRSAERRKGFDTINELKNFGEIILIDKISKIPGEDFKQSQEWNDRISKIKKIVLESLDRK
jgi:hypothetical protein